MKKIILALCLIAIMFIGQSGAEETKPPLQVAIYPLDVVGIEGTQGVIITNAIFRVLKQSGKLIVRDQQSTAAAIEQIGFGQSGLCSDDSCKVSAGKILNAQKLVMGSIEKLKEKLFTISLRVVDIETAATEYEVAKDFNCDEIVCIRDAAVQFARETIVIYLETGKKVMVDSTKPPETPPGPIIEEPPSSVTPPVAAGFGTLVITTTPPGAFVRLDGVDKGVTPLTLKDVPAGKHRITISAKGIATENRDVTLGANATLKVDITLRSSIGGIHIVTDPPGADVYIEGQPKGKTPLTVPNLYPNSYQVAIVKDGYNKLVKTVKVEQGKTFEVNETLAVLTGEVNISSAPSGASAFLDGKPVGKTPVKLPAVIVGKHTVAVKMPPDYKDYSSDITVGAESPSNVNAYLAGFPGRIVITSIPENAEVFIDDKKVGSTGDNGYSGEIPAGSHKVRVGGVQGYKSAEKTINIIPNGLESWDVTLEKGEDIKGGEMVYVPAGNFMMGCNKSIDKMCEIDEIPYHKIYLDAFYIDKYEVTVDQYKGCVNAGKCSEPNNKDDNEYCNWGYSYRGNHPINCIDWNQAQIYCIYAGKRLPTEAEWEKAARGTDGRKNPWGNQEASCSYAVMYEGDGGCGENSTWPVGSKPSGASPYGAMDMAGNVWEWVADWYDKTYYRKSPSQNPRGPKSGSSRILRGGGWDTWPSFVRSSARDSLFPSERNDYFGVRCAQ